MNGIGVTCMIAAAITVAWPAGPARGAEALLVVVESTPGLDIGASDVRRTIAAELAAPVRGPRDREADHADHVDEDGGVLIVALDSRELRMSFRAPGAAPVSRGIAAPTERSSRLRAIAWLAGNLARDQVSRLIVAAPSVAEPPPEPPRPMLVAPAVEPPPLPPVDTSRVAVPADAVTARAAPRSDTGPAATWAFTLSSGLTTTPHREPVGDVASLPHLRLLLEAQQQATADGRTFGAALEVGPKVEVFALAGFGGWTWRGAHWLVELTAGGGIQIARAPDEIITSNTMTNPMANPMAAMGESHSAGTIVRYSPALFVRGSGLVGLRMTKSLDLVARLGLGTATDDLASPIVMANAGLRLTLR